MSTRRKSKQPRLRNSSSKDMLQPRQPMVVTSGLNAIRIAPRTPKTPWTGHDDEDADEVELNLLDEEDRRLAAQGLGETEEQGFRSGSEAKRQMSAKDRRGMILLIILYLIQGVPVGLAMGSVPFILREHLSYSQLGVFALSSYPYSLKLLWSPIVDSVFFVSIGRRKSWIIPMQLVIGTLMLYISLNVQKLLDDPQHNVYQLTAIFGFLVLFSATQDIAVDGWALTLLSNENLSYASTCQTIGLNTGYFASFTVFLAFNSEAFVQKWGLPLLTLSAYLRFWSFICLVVTLWLVFVEKENKERPEDEDMSIKSTYLTIWEICKLKHVQSLIIMHIFAKVGFATNEAVTSLKMVEKGLGREDLAIAVLIDFPFQIIGGWLAARWSRGDKPLRPWVYAFIPRLGFALLATMIVYWFPTPPISTGFFIFLVIQTVLASFASTVQFVGISAFHTKVSDPLIGGTYMTLLNTFTNLGGTWPKYFVLKGVDFFTIATCQVQAGSQLVMNAECVSEHGKSECTALNGQCIVERDGYYWISGFGFIFGIVFLFGYIVPTARKLQALPTSQWRVNAK